MPRARASHIPGPTNGIRRCVCKSGISEHEYGTSGSVSQSLASGRSLSLDSVLHLGVGVNTQYERREAEDPKGFPKPLGSELFTSRPWARILWPSTGDADLCFSRPLCYNRGCRDHGDHLRGSNTSKTGGQENQSERAR